MVIKLKKILLYLISLIVIISIALLNIPTPTVYKANHIEFYDVNNELITSQIENKESNYIYLNQLNDYTINAFIAFEDQNFYSHKGFDLLRIIKSFFTNLITFSFKQGASTITQQYARTVFLSNKKSIIRKLKEAYYTIKLETKYTKNQILEGYLNTIYLGHNCYGIDAASRYYFNKSSLDLTLEESATLASLASSPSTSSPFNNLEKSKLRRNLVLKQMKKQGYITFNQYKEASLKEINLSYTYNYQSNINYYLDKVKEEIKTMKLSLNKGLKIYTNLDVSLYNTIEKLIEKYSYSNYQISLVILENNTNHILYSLGGKKYSDSNYNRSLYSKRQVGSTIKTFLYSLALENNFNLDTTLISEKTTFKIKNYGTYSPSNYNDNYANRKITMKEAYAVSDNIYAVKTLLLLGSDNFITYLKKFNLLTNESVPSIALGSSTFTLYDLIKAYSIYSNNGYLYNYSFINKITDSYNQIIYNNKVIKKYVLSNKIVELTKQLMTLPFSNNNYYTKPTLVNYNIKNYYGKSGSTPTDSYLILFNDKYTMGIWMGDDENNNLYDYTTSKYLLTDISNSI